MNIEDATKFVLANRKGNAFRDWQEHQIAHSIRIAIDKGTFAYVADREGNLTGLIVASLIMEDVLFIENVLTTDKEALKMLVIHFQQSFPNHLLMAKRKGKTKLYKNTQRLCHLILINSYSGMVLA